MSTRATRWESAEMKLGAALCLGLATLAGCVSEGRPERQEPVSIPAQPDGLKANKLVFTVAQVLEDRDRNGYYDTIPATVYLFDTSYAYSIRSSGSFVFTLTEPATGRAIASWDVPAADAARSQMVTWTGTIYPFQLDIREARRSAGVPESDSGAPGVIPAGDRLPASEVLIGCTFVPSEPGTKAVESGSRLTVLIGKTR